MDTGYIVLSCFIFAIILLMIYDICTQNKIMMHHILIAVLLVIASCILSIHNTGLTTPRPNTHPAATLAAISQSGDASTSTGVQPIIDKMSNLAAASPLVPNAYDVCVGLLDGKTPEELSKIASEMRSTSSDKVLERDASSLNPHWKDTPAEARRLIAMEIYPFMSGNQINTHDCLNDQGNASSCFQSPSMMTPEIVNGPPHPIGDNLSGNSKRMRFSQQASGVLNLREGFVSSNMPANLTGDSETPGVVDFNNAPVSQYVDEMGRLVVGDTCTHCKIGQCFNGYCGAANYYFF